MIICALQVCLSSPTCLSSRNSIFSLLAGSLITGSLTARISSALTDQRHVDALVLLSEMCIRNQQPRLGSLQRWVRECDAVCVPFSFDIIQHIVSDLVFFLRRMTPSMAQADLDLTWKVLDAILRTTQSPLPDVIDDSSEAPTKVQKLLLSSLYFHPNYPSPGRRTTTLV